MYVSLKLKHSQVDIERKLKICYNRFMENEIRLKSEKESCFNKPSDELERLIFIDKKNHWVNPYAFEDRLIVRRNPQKDIATCVRPAFVRDVEKILHLPLYNRYGDKTQVFSFYKNDDITRRGLHVQIVSRIARDIGQALSLNCDLIEAIALGHDIGHTPFGHAGERFLSELLNENTGRYFNHNVQSVRVLDKLYLRNISLQTLDGILCHNGEFEMKEYRPTAAITFDEFDKKVEKCYTDKDACGKLVPTTLEACVVRICDIIAYLGKDRQDARKALRKEIDFADKYIGKSNSEIINNLTIDILEHSYKKDYLLLSEEAFTALKTAKKENYEFIYKNEDLESRYNGIIKPMFRDVYYKLLDQLLKKDVKSVIYKHHVENIDDCYRYAKKEKPYSDGEPNQIVCDFIASMTDDYFIDLHEMLFPNSKYKIEYTSYFADLKK